MYGGNAQLVVLALLLGAIGNRRAEEGSGASGTAGRLRDLGLRERARPATALRWLAAATAVAFKVYVVVPLIGERRLLTAVVGTGIAGLTIVVAPGLWGQYLQSFSGVSARLAAESDGGFSAFSTPLLVIPTGLALLALARLDPRAAGWLVVTALWPATEFHYSTFAMPVATPALAAALAVPIPGLPAVAVIGFAAWRLAERAAEAWAIRAAQRWPRTLGP